MSEESTIQEKMNSLPPTHFLLALLHETKGNPVTAEKLIDRLSNHLKRVPGGSLLLKYTDIDLMVEDDLNYMKKLSLIEKVESWRITSLGVIMAMATLNYQAEEKKTKIIDVVISKEAEAVITILIREIQDILNQDLKPEIQVKKIKELLDVWIKANDFHPEKVETSTAE